MDDIPDDERPLTGFFRCGKMPKAEIYQKDPARHARSSREWYHLHKDRTRPHRKAIRQRYEAANREKMSQKASGVHYRKKLKVLVHLGGACCVRCRFSDLRVLQIDHIHGGGCKERRSIGGYNGILNRILSMSPDQAKQEYQVLCANCNVIKKHENREFAGVKHASLCLPTQASVEVATGAGV